MKTTTLSQIWRPSPRNVFLSLFYLLPHLLLGPTPVECTRHSSNCDSLFLEYSAINCRSHTASILDYGGVCDGVTSNTAAFRNAVHHLSRYASYGGALLFVPAGRWLTGSFNLTSHLTIFLHKDAVILASTDIHEWPLIEPLASYGRGRDAPGGRFISLIFGTNLTDVVITGNNGTIDGQGSIWWQEFHGGKLKNTRPYLIELMHSDTIQISNLTLLNSPSWNIHPVYSRNVLVRGVTILAPVRSPNTDGINPDSCVNTRIEDCYIVSGDDCVAVKSGWDEYGIAVAAPTEHLVIRRITCISPTSAAIAVGSEMSGGVRDVRVEDVVAVGTESGVRVKTGMGRGGFVEDLYVRGMRMETMKWAFWITGDYGSHADEGYNRTAAPVVRGINYMDIWAENVTMAGRLEGIAGDVFTGLCISNATIGRAAKGGKKVQWECTNVEGVWSGVTPEPCPELRDSGTVGCDFPVLKIPMDDVKLRRCSAAARHGVCGGVAGEDDEVTG